MTQSIYPALRYADAHAAIDFLCKAFGFERLAVYESGNTVEHAELALGNSIIMLGSMRDVGSVHFVTPKEAGGVTGSIYIGIENVDAHHDRAVAAGARVVRPLTDEDYGSRDYMCLDPEGNVWSFGTYAPQAQATPRS